MIKLLLLLIALSSCSYINYGELPGLIKTSFIGIDLEIDTDFYNAQEYSFLKINLGKAVVAVLVLAQVDGNRYTWISESDERIITQHGRVIATYGLARDASILDAFVLEPIHHEKKSDVLRQLESPKALVQQSFSVKKIGLDSSFKYLNKNISSTLYIETIYTDLLKWEFKNKYWVNASGQVLKSEQFIHPNLPLIKLEFYFK